jgi:adenosylhomocysteinase
VHGTEDKTIGYSGAQRTVDAWVMRNGCNTTPRETYNMGSTKCVTYGACREGAEVVFCTVTGNKNVLAREHFEVMKDGAIISNSGHFNVEIDIPALEKLSSSKRTTRTFVEEYSLRDGRKINLLGEGRLINLASAEGHPPSVMDMSFADQALSVEYMVKNYKTLEKRVYKVPEDLDKRVARLKLESTGIKIDKLTPEQEEYLAGWNEGT